MKRTGSFKIRMSSVAKCNQARWSEDHSIQQSRSLCSHQRAALGRGKLLLILRLRRYQHDTGSGLYRQHLSQRGMERHRLNYTLARELLGQEKGLPRQEQKSLLVKEKKRTTEEKTNGANLR